MVTLDGTDLVYTTALVATAILAFWDAPYRLLRADRPVHVNPSIGYHLLNLASVMVVAAWAAVVFVLGPDGPVLWWAGTARGALRALGLLVALAGFAYALWARFALGRAFNPTSAVAEGQAVVTRGPFGHVRHPFYAGLWLALAGGVLALDSVATLAAIVLLTPLVRLVAALEERFLQQELGPAYADYQARVPAFVPRPRR